MAVPNSGELKLKDDILLEVKMNSTGSDPTGPNNNPSASLHQMSIESQFSTPDAMGDFYGYVSAEPPVATSCNFTSVTDSTMTANGHVANPASVATCYGFYFGTSTNRTSNPFYGKGNSTSANFTYNRGFGSLSGGTTYRHWAYACNVAGTSAGNMCSATTCASIAYCNNAEGGGGSSLVFLAGEPDWSPTLNNNVCNRYNASYAYQHYYFGMTNLSNYAACCAKDNSGTVVVNSQSGCRGNCCAQICVDNYVFCTQQTPNSIYNSVNCIQHRAQRAYSVITYGYASTNFNPTYACMGFLNFYHGRRNPSYNGQASVQCSIPAGMSSGGQPNLHGAWAMNGSVNPTSHFKSCTMNATAHQGQYKSDIRLKTNINYL